VSSASSGLPFAKNCTPLTPTLSAAVAVMVTVPDTVAPLAGPVIATVGAVVSPPGRIRLDCWVCGVAALACAKVVVDVVVALAKSTVAGADNAVIDGSARACRSP
jgi:hypothetical protein